MNGDLKFNHGSVRLYHGDARHMTALQDGEVQCVVTSPPYWGLRQYASGEAPLVWGGNPECLHEWEESSRKMIHHKDKELANWSAKYFRGGGNKQVRIEDEIVTEATCLKCGAWAGAYGNEPTIQAYIDHSVLILREVRRVLSNDGVVFWNIGDTYAGSWGGSLTPESMENYPRFAKWKHDASRKYDFESRPPSAVLHGKLKKKDLCLIPQRLAIAVQDDGWWVRSIIVWAKANSKPESVKDRPTAAHEYLLMLTKAAKYYWNYDAGLEPYTEALDRWGGDTYKEETDRGRTYRDDVLGGTGATSLGRKGRPIRPNPKGKNMRSVWRLRTDGFDIEMCLDCRTVYEAAQYRRLEIQDKKRVCVCGSQNWLSHFAVFPQDLPEKCIKVASREGDLILDPFAGTGTTLAAAANLGRRAVGYEISDDYCDLIIHRNKQGALL